MRLIKNNNRARVVECRLRLREVNAMGGDVGLLFGDIPREAHGRNHAEPHLIVNIVFQDVRTPLTRQPQPRLHPLQRPPRRAYFPP